MVINFKLLEMMKKIFYIAVILLAGVFILNSCSEDDDYNWGSYQPVIVGTINGPAAVAASGLIDYPVSYEMSYVRGGSSFEWTVTTYSGEGTPTVTLEEKDGCPGKVAKIVFPQRAALDTAYVSVVEVSSKGVSSEPKVKKIILNAFCPLTIDDFVGTFDAVQTRSTGTIANYAVVITKDDDNTLRVNTDVTGIPGFLQNVFTAWGEHFVAGLGQEGDILMDWGIADGTLTLEKGAYWGRTDYDYDYWYVGSGNWSGCTNTMTVSFEMHYDDLNFNDGGNHSYTIVIDLTTKK